MPIGLVVRTVLVWYLAEVCTCKFRCVCALTYNCSYRNPVQAAIALGLYLLREALGRTSRFTCLHFALVRGMFNAIVDVRGFLCSL